MTKLDKLPDIDPTPLLQQHNHQQEQHPNQQPTQTILHPYASSSTMSSSHPLSISTTHSISPSSTDTITINPIVESPSGVSTNCSTDSIKSSDKTHKWRTRQVYIILVLMFFAGSSLGAIFINKTCLTGYHFRYPLTLFLLQMLFSISLLTVLHISGQWQLPPAHINELRSLIFPCLLFIGNVIIGLYALSLVNIPMFSALRRLTLLFVMVAEFLLLGKKYSQSIIICVVIMASGAFVSAIDDVSFSRVGYALVFLNNMFTAAYLAVIKRAMKDTQFDPVALLYYTGLISIPIVTIILLYSGELKDVVSAFRTQPELSTGGFFMAITLTACGALAVNVSTSLCTHVTSPLTTSVAGQVKNVLQTLLGLFSWGFVPTIMNVGGLIVALCAQLWFAYLKFLEKQKDLKTSTNCELQCMNSDKSKILNGGSNDKIQVWSSDDDKNSTDDEKRMISMMTKEETKEKVDRLIPMISLPEFMSRGSCDTSLMATKSCHLLQRKRYVRDTLRDNFGGQFRQDDCIGDLDESEMKYMICEKDDLVERSRSQGDIYENEIYREKAEKKLNCSDLST